MKRTPMRKKGDVDTAAGLRFDVAIERAGAATTDRALVCVSATATSWKIHAESHRTYVRSSLTASGSGALQAVALAAAGARVSVPPIVALDVRPARAADAPLLARALAGPGGPAGVRDVAAYDGGLVVELDDAVTPLAVAIAFLDATLAGRGRTVVPLLPLEDGTLAAFASGLLGDVALARDRIMETYVNEAGPAPAARS